MRRLVALGAVAGVVVGCAPKEITYQVNVLAKSCDSATDPFGQVQFVRVRVTGDGITVPLVAVSAKDARGVKIPEIPAGPNRVIEVRGYDGDPSGSGKVISIGKSLPFIVPDIVPDDVRGPVAVNVFVRRVGVFSAPVSAEDPSRCQSMLSKRAGHTATLLDNGRVFVAGGYNQTGAFKTALSDTELFDPSSGTFIKTKDISIQSPTGEVKLPKAFHTATKLPSGQVLLWGGESYVQQNNMPTNIVAPNANVVVYDADQDLYGATRRDSPPSIARSRHSAAIDANGMVLIVGGVTRTAAGLTPADKVEWFVSDSKSANVNKYFIVDAVTLPRLDPAVSAVRNGEFIAVAGGSDGTAMANDVAFFKFDTSSQVFRQQMLANAPRLADPGRRGAGVATVRDGADLLVLGGFTDAAIEPTSYTPVSSSEIVSTQSSMVARGPTVGTRGGICAVTLADGRVMAIGGRTVDMSGSPTHSDLTTTIIASDGSGGTTGAPGPGLPAPRYSHTCTLLKDGSVLVTGGVNEQTTGTLDVLQDAWIYTPPPAD